MALGANGKQLSEPFARSCQSTHYPNKLWINGWICFFLRLEHACYPFEPWNEWWTRRRENLYEFRSLHVVHSCDIPSFLDTNGSYSFPFVCCSLFALTRACALWCFVIKPTFRLAMLYRLLCSIHSLAFISFSFVRWPGCCKTLRLKFWSKNRNASYTRAPNEERPNDSLVVGKFRLCENNLNNRIWCDWGFRQKIHKFCNKIPKRVNAHKHTRAPRIQLWQFSLMSFFQLENNPLFLYVQWHCVNAWPTWPAERHHPTLRFQLSIYFTDPAMSVSVLSISIWSMHWPLAITRRTCPCGSFECVCVFSIEYIKFCRSNSAPHPLNEIECHKKYINSMAQVRTNVCNSVVCFLWYCNSWFRHWPHNIVPNFNRIEIVFLFILFLFSSDGKHYTHCP